MRVLLVSEGKHERSGSLERLVRRLAPTELQLDQDRISRSDIHAHHDKGCGYFKRVIRWMLEAQHRGYEALILLIDEDHYPERVAEISDAQESQLARLRRALGVAIHTFDAWMLADERCLARVLGCTIQRQPDPETIEAPKSACMALLARSGSQISQTQMYAAVMSLLELDALEARCPAGFAPFARRVRAL